MMDLNEGQKVPYAASSHDKQLALADDYLRAGKSVDWVISMVAGKDTKAQASVCTKAAQLGILSSGQLRDKLRALRIDEKGNKKK